MRALVREVLAAMALAVGVACGLVLLTRLTAGYWGLHVLWLLPADMILLLAASGGAAPVGRSAQPVQNCWEQAQADVQTTGQSLVTAEQHRDFNWRRIRGGGFRMMPGLAAVFLLALWLMVGR